MRIRRNAGRLLGSAYWAPAPQNADGAGASELPTMPQQPAPPQHLVPCWAPESCAVGGLASPDTALAEPCELSRSPWDLIAELSISDPQVEDDLVGKYFVSVRASWLFPASMPVSSVKKKKQAQAVGGGTTSQPPPQQVLKKAPKKSAVSKETEPKKKAAKVKKEVDWEEEVKQPAYKCKKNDGRRWQCLRPVKRPDSLCDYHLYKKRAYLNPELAAPVEAVKKAEMVEVPQPAPASKPATSSKSRKKKPGHDFGVTEGFYYYAGFGPCRSKRLCRSNSNMNEFVPPKKEEEEAAEDGPPASELMPQAAAAAVDDSNQAAPAACDGESDCVDFGKIAGVDEDSSDDNYGLGSSGRHRVGNSDGKRKGSCKRWRKPVKARSLKSLM